MIIFTLITSSQRVTGYGAIRAGAIAIIVRRGGEVVRRPRSLGSHSANREFQRQSSRAADDDAVAVIEQAGGALYTAEQIGVVRILTRHIRSVVLIACE